MVNRSESLRARQRRIRRRQRAGALFRLCGVVLCGGTLAWVLSYHLFDPYRIAEEQERRLAELQRRHAHLREDNEHLLRYGNYLATREGKEVLARRSGFQYRGEQVYLVREDEKNHKELPVHLQK